ncbi:MAG: CBS domain-containing protein, partial [Pseudomonadota bacterium]
MIEIPEIKPLPAGGLEVITTHLNADFDAMASMIGAGKLYPQAVMVFPGSVEKNLRNFYIQSVIYLFNVARIKDIKMEAVRRLILVDTRQAGRIGPLEKILKNKGLAVHIYDHHPDSPDDIRGEVEVIEPVGATATVMTEILSAKNIALTPDEATILALGIYEDTGSFVFGSTTPRDYLAASGLLEQGADLKVVAEMISRELTVEQVSLLNELLTSAQTHIINGIEVVVSQASREHYVDELAVLVHKIMDIKSISVMFALVGMAGRVYLVARSRQPQVDVGEITKQLGGGGHPSAAAAAIKDLPLTQAVAELLRVLTKALGPVWTARDIMSYPIISIGPEGDLTEAREILIRYDINVLLVTGETGEVLGYISRQNVSKALYHELPDYKVSDFMTTEFAVINPEATFAEIRTLIVEQKQRVLPVVENGQAVGVITRTDLLNILTSETNVPDSLIEDESQDGRTKNVLSLMHERLPRKIVDLLAELGRNADTLGYGAYAVGGFVRDLLLRQENLDIDIVIEGDANHFADIFAQAHPGVKVRHHRKFNTALLLFPDGFKVDVTTARLEYYEHPGALPVVQEGSLRMDLYRRDFTINTLAIYLNQKHFGIVVDYFRGLRDIKEGFIRVLHNLSLVEDPTRVFRAIRFEQRFGFKIGKMTAALIQNSVKHNVFRNISGKRLLGEIRHILQEEDPGPAVMRLAEFDLLQFIHPGLVLDQKLLGHFRRIKKVRDWFDLTYLEEKYEPWLIYYLGLLNNLSRQEMEEVCVRLIPRKRERQILVEEKPQTDKILAWFSQNHQPRPSELYQHLR